MIAFDIGAYQRKRMLNICHAKGNASTMGATNGQVNIVLLWFVSEVINISYTIYK